MQRITNKLHLHRKGRNPVAPAPAQDTLIKPTSVPLNAQGQPISPLPATTPLAAQPSLTQQTISTQTLPQQTLPQQQWHEEGLQQGFSLQKPGIQQGLQQNLQPGLQQQVLPTITRPPIVESIVRPARIEQTTRIEKVVEMQPVIHRQVDAPQVRIIEQHTYEAAPMVGPSIVTNPTIVEEVVKPRIIEEVQPVIHREVPAPVLQRVEQHIQEHVVQPAVTNKVIQQNSVATVQPAVARALPVQAVAQQPTIMSQTAAPLTETRTLPTVVEQTMRPEKVVEVQPVIHRNVDQPRVRVIEQHSYEQVRSTGPSVVYRQPLVQDTVVPRIIEDIQPVIHREVPQIVVERQEQHLSEQVTQPTTTIKQVLEDRTIKPLPALPQQARAAPIAKPLPATPAVHSVTAAPIVESHTRAAIIEQTARPEIIQEVQPIIHREIDTSEIRVIEQHSFEKVASTGPSTVTLAPVIQETLHPKIIEEIHPVLHRSVPQPFLERIEQHTTENITQPVVTTKEVVNTQLHPTILQQQQLGTFQQQTFAPLATTIPPAPPLPQKSWRNFQQQPMTSSFSSPMMRSSQLAQNIPPAPPLPSNLSTQKGQQVPVGFSPQQAQQAGGVTQQHSWL